MEVFVLCTRLCSKRHLLPQGSVPHPPPTAGQIKRFLASPVQLWSWEPFLSYLFIYLLTYERQSSSRGGAETEGDTESQAGSRLRAVSTEPDVGLEPTNCEIMT